MAALADYLDLRIAVADLVGRDDLSDVFPRLVQSAESRLNKDLRTADQITDATLTLSSGSASLPSDFLEMIHVYDGQGRPMRAGTLADVAQSGSEYWLYALDGSNLKIYGVDGDRDITYYAALSTLTASPTTSNWLLASHPDVYLHAVAYEAAKHLREAEVAAAMKALLADSLAAVSASDETHRWANATVRLPGVTP
jgi:hypothetical protein